MKEDRLNWKRYALKLASVTAERSEDPYLQVGACILRNDNSVAALGYNGAPAGIEIDWQNRDQRRSRVIHAEINALRYIQPNECYLLACTHLPCNDCLKNIAAYGIKEIVFGDVYNRDMSSLNLAQEFSMTLWTTSDISKKVQGGEGKAVLSYRDKYNFLND